MTKKKEIIDNLESVLEWMVTEIAKYESLRLKRGQTHEKQVQYGAVVGVLKDVRDRVKGAMTGEPRNSIVSESQSVGTQKAKPTKKRARVPRRKGRRKSN